MSNKKQMSLVFRFVDKNFDFARRIFHLLAL